MQYSFSNIDLIVRLSELKHVHVVQTSFFAVSHRLGSGTFSFLAFKLLFFSGTQITAYLLGRDARTADLKHVNFSAMVTYSRIFYGAQNGIFKRCLSRQGIISFHSRLIPQSFGCYDCKLQTGIFLMFADIYDSFLGFVTFTKKHVAYFHNL